MSSESGEQLPESMGESPSEFIGKRVMVTGAGQGIGRAVAKALAKEGADVIAVSRTEEHLLSLKRESPNINIQTLDLSEWQSTEYMVKCCLPIDLLVNNAGIASLGSVGEITEEEFKKVFAINVRAPLNISQVVANDLKRRGVGGSIVNVSSKASLIALPDHAVYGASKAALDQLTKVMALELGPHQIRVNSVNPTVVLTALALPAWGTPEKADPLKKNIPLGRFADQPCFLLPLGISSYEKDGNTFMRLDRPSAHEKPYIDIRLPNTTEDALGIKEVDDVVNAIMFLLSSKSAMITGVCLPVDGGYTIH